MNWQALGTIAEIIGALVVVATVMYLAIQTRQHTLAVQASVRQAMLSDDLAILFKQMDFPFCSVPTYGKRELTDDQMVQLTTWLMALMRTRESYWLQYRSGGIDEATWDTYRLPLQGALSSQIGKSLWNNLCTHGWLNAEFASAINRHLADETIEIIGDVRELLSERVRDPRS